MLEETYNQFKWFPHNAPPDHQVWIYSSILSVLAFAFSLDGFARDDRGKEVGDERETGEGK